MCRGRTDPAAQRRGERDAKRWDDVVGQRVGPEWLKPTFKTPLLGSLSLRGESSSTIGPTGGSLSQPQWHAIWTGGSKSRPRSHSRQLRELKAPQGLCRSAGRGDPGVPSTIPFEKGSGRAGIKGTCPPKPPISVLSSRVATEKFDTRPQNHSLNKDGAALLVTSARWV